jgi:hypothetical protein
MKPVIGETPDWRAIHYGRSRVMVAICPNMDLGDAWSVRTICGIRRSGRRWPIKVAIDNVVYGSESRSLMFTPVECPLTRSECHLDGLRHAILARLRAASFLNPQDDVVLLPHRKRGEDLLQIGLS